MNQTILSHTSENEIRLQTYFLSSPFETSSVMSITSPL